MVGGIVTSAFLILDVIPVRYTIWRYHQLRKRQRLAAELESDRAARSTGTFSTDQGVCDRA